MSKDVATVTVKNGLSQAVFGKDAAQLKAGVRERMGHWMGVCALTGARGRGGKRRAAIFELPL